MKKGLYVIFAIISLSAYAKSIYELDLRRSLNLAKQSINKGYFLGSLPFLKEALVITKEPNQELDQYLDQVLERTGHVQISFIPNDILEKSNSLYAKVTRAKHYFSQKDHDKALSSLDSIDENHFIASYAYSLKAAVFMKIDNFGASRDNFDMCIKLSDKKRSEFKKIDTRHEYFSYIHDLCIISKARTYYKENELTLALKHYSEVDMRSYFWPSSLLEASWTLYRLKDYNTSIGRTLSLRAPYLSDYFFPESELLAGMSFFKICHWDEVKKILNYFDKNHYRNSLALINFLNKGNITEENLLKIVIQKKNFFKTFSISDQIFNRIRNTPSFIYHSNLFHLGVNELKRIKADKNNDRLAGLFYNNAKRELKLKATYLGYRIKSELYRIANEFTRISQILSLLGIEVHGFKRDKIANRLSYQTDIEEIDFVRTSSNVNWSFKNEFWADEIGSYVWSKDSRCPKN